ncbi:hypothetical protein IEO21_04490 [Rhodonia placenta]|uniref:Uncharacterized protein n=1 Tax=Rhodonia placenta TaxID=104341 RepID=A0A8H7U2Z1_9APHY|nr:hypothetical protein IEO21_04490 [Postia placenta]
MQCRKPPEDSRQSPVGSLLPFMGTLGQETLRAPVTPVQSPKRLLSSPPEAERVQRPRLRFEDDSPPQEAVEDDRPPHLRLPPFSSLLKIADAGEAKNSRRAKTQPSSPSEDSCSNLFDPRTNPEHMQALSASSKPGLGSAFQFEPADKSAQNASDDGDTPPRRHNTSQDDSVVVKSPRTASSQRLGGSTIISEVVASQPNVPLVRRTNDARVPSTPLSSLPGRSSYQQRPLSRDQSGSVKPRLPSIQQLKESNGLPDPRELGPPPQVPQVPPLIVPKPRKPQLSRPTSTPSVPRRSSTAPLLREERGPRTTGRRPFTIYGLSYLVRPHTATF